MKRKGKGSGRQLRHRGKRKSGSTARHRPVRRRRTRWLAATFVVLAAGLVGTGVWWIYRTTADAIVIPEFSAKAKAGARLFAANCASCHGTNSTGTEQGPPLVHKIYEPGHHPDASFQRAVKQGVMSHHWRFGHMPPVPDLSQQEVAKIIAFVRELQRANGIY